MPFDSWFGVDVFLQSSIAAFVPSHSTSWPASGSIF
jgi:hypothetical protein